MLALVDWLVEARPARTRRPGSASSATARGARSPSTPRRSTRGSTPSASAATSTTATTSGRQPIDRNVFGLLEQFGDAELASLVAPRTLDRRGGARAPSSSTRPGTGGAPGKIDDARARDGQGRGRAGPRARRRARSRARASSWSPAARTAPDRSAPTRRSSKLLAALDPGAKLRDRAADRRRSELGRHLAARASRPARPASSTSSTATTSSSWSRARTSARSSWRSSTPRRPRPTRRRSSRTARSSPTRSSAGSTEPLLPPNVRSRQGLRRAEVHRLRGRAGRLPRRDRLRHPALAQGHQGRARSGRWSSASTGWRAGRATSPTRR